MIQLGTINTELGYDSLVSIPCS
uniref:Uncharacterized protein n=1 Tax=Rhizophora mucronata TaxID=61149 RepID=A0A2P2K185_RHIMU